MFPYISRLEDDIILQLEKGFRSSYNHIIETVENWTGINIDY